MTIVSPLHRYFSQAHLEHVAAQMRELGAPRLRGYHDATSGCWLLMEGTHRIRAAKQLGLTPVLISVPWWRSAAALERARFAAAEYGYLFPVVDVAPTK